jgi:hypothetical protein
LRIIAQVPGAQWWGCPKGKAIAQKAAQWSFAPLRYAALRYMASSPAHGQPRGIAPVNPGQNYYSSARVCFRVLGVGLAGPSNFLAA